MKAQKHACFQCKFLFSAYFPPPFHYIIMEKVYYCTYKAGCVSGSIPSFLDVCVCVCFFFPDENLVPGYEASALVLHLALVL